jgi:hypothetical protein
VKLSFSPHYNYIHEGRTTNKTQALSCHGCRNLSGRCSSINSAPCQPERNNHGFPCHQVAGGLPGSRLSALRGAIGMATENKVNENVARAEKRHANKISALHKERYRVSNGQVVVSARAHIVHRTRTPAARNEPLLYLSWCAVVTGMFRTKTDHFQAPAKTG